eukprot:COSAG02_NODE_49384_length_327_cov_0.684211_1_plen_69_part_01
MLTGSAQIAGRVFVPMHGSVRVHQQMHPGREPRPFFSPRPRRLTKSHILDASPQEFLHIRIQVLEIYYV